MSIFHFLKIDYTYVLFYYQKFPLESEDSILTSTLKQFSSYLDDVSIVLLLLCAPILFK